MAFPLSCHARNLVVRWKVTLLTFVIESTCLALAGGLLGCLVALPVNDVTSSAGGANFAEVAFAFRISPAALLAGIAFAAVMGIAGGLLPALRAARLPIATALREG
jgi:putative ABC transport system permease protein